MILTFATQPGLKVWQINVEAQKIDGITLETYEMVVPIFSVLDKDSRERFLGESFFLANIKLNIVLGMLFLTISNANIDFQV